MTGINGLFISKLHLIDTGYPTDTIVFTMKKIILLPTIYLATATFVSFTVLIKPLIKRLRNKPDSSIKKYQKSFYLSKR